MTANAWCGRGAGATTVRARSRGGNGESVELPVAVHTSGDQTRLDLLLSHGDPWDVCLL
jgi:hypothetical protein